MLFQLNLCNALPPEKNSSRFITVKVPQSKHHCSTTQRFEQPSPRELIGIQIEKIQPSDYAQPFFFPFQPSYPNIFDTPQDLAQAIP